MATIPEIAPYKGDGTTPLLQKWLDILWKWIRHVSSSITALEAIGITGFATQADQETATSLVKIVPPGRQQFHPSAAKFWIRLNGTGTIAIKSSYNVTSITDNGTGDYIVTIATDFSADTWTPWAMCSHDGGALVGTIANLVNEANITAGTVRVQLVDPVGDVLVDRSIVCVGGFGDQ